MQNCVVREFMAAGNVGRSVLTSSFSLHVGEEHQHGRR